MKTRNDKWRAVAVYYNNVKVGEVPAYDIASQRAHYYATADTKGLTEPTRTSSYNEIFAAEVEYVLRDDYELIDWMRNNTEWEDIKDMFRGDECFRDFTWDLLEFRLEKDNAEEV